MPADRGAEGDRVKTTEAAWFTQAPRAVVDTWALVGSALRDGQAGAQPRDPKTLSVVGGRAGLPGAPLCLGLPCAWGLCVLSLGLQAPDSLPCQQEWMGTCSGKVWTPGGLDCGVEGTTLIC